MNGLLVDDLRNELARGRVILLVGAGVSVGATGGDPVASWTGLLENGVARCEELALRPLPAGWGDRTRAQIQSGDVEELLQAAEAVTYRLGGRDHGEYRRWLQETVGRLTAGHLEVLEVLRDLGGISATTNYDGLLEQVTGRPAVTWRDTARAQAVLRGDEQAIVHLHGFWQQPESVVLGVRSYEQLLSAEHAQAMQQAMAAMSTLLLVGFGAGLADPNFAALRKWMARLFKGSEYRHFRLATDGEVDRLRAEHNADERVVVLGYGPSHADLAPFLRSLALAAAPPPATAARPSEQMFDGELGPEDVLRVAQSVGLTTGQLQAIAAAVAATPQLATERGRGALFAALQNVVGPSTRTDDPDADLLDLVSAVLGRHASAALFGVLDGLAANDEERIAVVAVRRSWELQVAVAPLLGSLQRAPRFHILGAYAETVCDVPADISDLAKVLERLADLNRPGLAVSPIAEFVVRLQQRRPDLEIPAQWFSNQGLDEAAVAALRSRVASEAGIRGKLVIDLRESAPARWQTAVTGYLGPGWCPRTVECNLGADGVRGAVVKIVEWARSQATDLTIGFLLRYDLLRELPEQWEYEDEVVAPIRLGEEYPVVLHAAERMTVPRLRPVWDRKLAAIEESAADPPSVLWLERDDAAAIRRAVQASNDAYVAFTFVPEARPDSRTTAVMAALAAGAPYVVWVQTAPANDYDLRGRLGQMLGPIRDFPATLPQRRADDSYMSDALRVIWDRLDELPPFLGRLGEGLVSNG